MLILPPANVEPEGPPLSPFDKKFPEVFIFFFFFFYAPP